MMRYLRFQLAALLINLPRAISSAISFTGWLDDICKSLFFLPNQILEPEACFSTGRTRFSSLRAFGLEDTNDEGADYIQLYADPACQNPGHVVKYSDICLRLEFRSLMYFPTTIDKETRERINASKNVTESAEQQQADDDLELLLLRMEQAYERTGNVDAMEEVTRQWRMRRSGEQRNGVA